MTHYKLLEGSRVNKPHVNQHIVAGHELLDAIDPLFRPTAGEGKDSLYTQLHVMNDDEVEMALSLSVWSARTCQSTVCLASV